MGEAHQGKQSGMAWGVSKTECDEQTVNGILTDFPDAVDIAVISRELPPEKVLSLTNYLNQQSCLLEPNKAVVA